MGWPKGKSRGPRKVKVIETPVDRNEAVSKFLESAAETLVFVEPPSGPPRTFGPEAYEAVHPEMAAASPTLPQEPVGVSGNAPLTNGLQLDTRDAILLGLCEPPPHYRKAADYQLGKGPWEIIRCRECGLDTYSKDSRKHDVCENCLWTLMHQLADVEQARIVRNTDRMLNPFRSSGDPFHELSGSLPSVKK